MALEIKFNSFHSIRMIVYWSLDFFLFLNDHYASVDLHVICWCILFMERFSIIASNLEARSHARFWEKNLGLKKSMIQNPKIWKQNPWKCSLWMTTCFKENLPGLFNKGNVSCSALQYSGSEFKDYRTSEKSHGRWNSRITLHTLVHWLVESSKRFITVLG